MSAARSIWWFIPCVLLLFAGFGRAQSTTEYPVHSIVIEGNRILPPAGIIAASGLKVGEKTSPAGFEAARDRLLASGYFETAGFKYKPSDDKGFDVTFEVREMQPLYPIRVEALGVTAAEVTAWLKTKDPLFTGRMPGTQQALDRTSREIESHLGAKVGAKVVSVTTERFEVLITPAAGLPNVANVTFEGNKAVRDTDLQNAIAAVAFGQPYTESSFRVLLDNQIRGVYEKSGYMHVQFPKIVTTRSTQVTGVDVKVTVDEGDRYKLGAVSVRGAMADDSKHILRVAKVPQMAVVDFDQVRQAAIRIKDSLRHEGYMDAEVSTDREVHEDRKTVDVVLIPQPGPQYVFGKLEIKGLGLDGIAALEKAWSVKKGDQFPAEYPDYFLKQVKEMGLFDNLGETRFEQEVSPDTHVVDVTLYFRYERQEKKKKVDDPGQPQLPI